MEQFEAPLRMLAPHIQRKHTDQLPQTKQPWATTGSVFLVSIFLYQVPFANHNDNVVFVLLK